MESTMTDFILVFMTTSDRAEAENITLHLLDERLIACCNIIGPVSSRYWWNEKVEEANEFLVTMKTRQALFEKLSARIEELHSYDVPEVIALPITAGVAILPKLDQHRR
jgi:periplasmic divalent cation tolerance protein